MKKKKIISQICIHVILVALSAICLLPFLSMISTSFMKVKGVLPNEPILFPNFPLYLENYVKAWTANHFQTYFFNTLYVSVVGDHSQLCRNHHCEQQQVKNRLLSWKLES